MKRFLFLLLSFGLLFFVSSAEASHRRLNLLPALTLVKVVINDNGGTKKVEDFTLHIDGKTVKSGVPKTLLPGKHKAGEIVIPDYTASVWGGDCASDGSIRLRLRQNAVCTITNDDVTPPFPSIVSDNFNSYGNGSIVGQGGWESYVNGENWFVQGDITLEGTKALHNSTSADSLVGKAGILLLDGRQAVYIKTNNRSGWHADSGYGLRISEGLNGYPFISVDFKKDGSVRYYDPGSGSYKNFATYNDNEWTLLETEWRSIDKKARYRVSNGSWTDWYPIANAESFNGFNYVNSDFYLPSGSGEVYVDNLH